MLLHCRMSHSISRRADGGVRRIGVEIGRERGRDDADRAAFDDRFAPQRAGLGVAERDSAFEILAKVVGVSSGADVHEAGDHAFGRCGKGIDAERQPVLVPRQRDLVLRARTNDRDGPCRVFPRMPGVRVLLYNNARRCGRGTCREARADEPIADTVDGRVVTRVPREAPILADELDVVERCALVERRPECVDHGIDRGVKTGARLRVACRLAGEAHQSEGGHPQQDHKPRGRPLRVVALQGHFLRAISSTAFIQYAFDPM